jgi:hypothetical protein
MVAGGDDTLIAGPGTGTVRGEFGNDHLDGRDNVGGNDTVDGRGPFVWSYPDETPDDGVELS